MLRSKKLFKNVLWIVFAMGLILAYSSYGQIVDEQKETAGSGDRSNEWIDNTMKSVRIMSDVLNDVLAREFSDEFKQRGFFSEGCQGYWIPDSGVLFVLSVNFPLKSEEVEIEVKEKQEEEMDLWEKHEKQISHSDEVMWNPDSPPVVPKVSHKVVIQERNRTAMFFHSGEFDQTKVKRLKDTILDALAKYGNRIEGFSGEETITVIVNGSESNIVVSSNMYEEPGVKKEESAGIAKSSGVRQERSTGIATSVGVNTVVLTQKRGPFDNKKTTMIIRIPFKNLPKEEGTANDIAEETRITVY